MASKLFVVLAALAVVAAIHAASVSKRETKTDRPEVPLLHLCDEPGENRENCFIQDPSNLDIWKIYMEEIDAWEKSNPTGAETYNKANPDTKKKEAEKLAELEKLAKVHE